MKLIRLDHTGHTELELGTDEMIRELERDMNSGRKVVIAEEPGKEPVYLRSPDSVRDLDPSSRIMVAPQLQGG